MLRLLLFTKGSASDTENPTCNSVIELEKYHAPVPEKSGFYYNLLSKTDEVVQVYTN